MKNYSLFGLVFSALLISGCGGKSKPAAKKVQPTSMAVRAERRAFQGSPPVIPHKRLGAKCITCHTADGDKVLPKIGIAPANPHLKTPGMSEESRCEQCHVFEQTDELFVENEFSPYLVSLEKTKPADSRIPPAVPHGFFMREDCSACHSTPAARPEIRCNHAERKRCRQCHIAPSPTLDAPGFVSTAGPST